MFGPTDHPSTGLAATTRGSNARSVSASSSSTGPRTLDLQGTGLGRDAGPRQYGRPVGGHAHRTRQVGHVHDPVDGDRLHRHRGGASNDPCPRTRSGRDSSRLTTRDLRRGHDHVRRPSVHRVRIGATRGHSETGHEAPPAVVGRGMSTGRVDGLPIPFRRDGPKDRDVHEICRRLDVHGAPTDPVRR
ncbi:unnamed protein product [Sphagnum tenellum]